MDFELLKLCVRLSKLCYSTTKVSSPDITKIQNDPVIIDTNSDPEPTCTIWTSIDNETLYVCFKGTSSIEDIYTDIEICMTQCKINNDWMIHKGFLQEYYLLEKKLSNILDNCNQKNIIFTGHSLGGAIAIIASAMYSLGVSKLDKNISCYTFGCPTIGNKQFTKDYIKIIPNYIGIINKNDPISFLKISNEFYHVDNILWIKKKNFAIYSSKFKQNTYINFIRKCIKSFDLNDHKCINYIEAIDNLRNYKIIYKDFKNII